MFKFFFKNEAAFRLRATRGAAVAHFSSPPHRARSMRPVRRRLGEGGRSAAASETLRSAGKHKNAAAGRGRPSRAPLFSKRALNPSTLQRFNAPALILALILLTGCRTIAPLPPANLAEPGWTVRQGQAVWRAKHDAPEIAGEILVATRGDGRAFVQFTKTPLPFAVAQRTRESWQVEFPIQNRRYSGRGNPPARLVWLHLPDCLAGTRLAKAWSCEHSGEQWRLENAATGELLEGYLAP